MASLRRLSHRSRQPLISLLKKNHYTITNTHLLRAHSTKTPILQSSWHDTPSRTDIHDPGSLAFADCETQAVTDLFYEYAKTGAGGKDEGGRYLCLEGIKELLASIGEHPDEETLLTLFRAVDMDGDGKMHLKEFLVAADEVLAGPARTVLVVGGPGSGKYSLCQRLSEECSVKHLSCAGLLREEILLKTPLGNECAQVMSRGELVSSDVITALVRRRMRSFPGQRVLLDGFPRSRQNAIDFSESCGKPELALHLECDDAILIERLIKRARWDDTEFCGETEREKIDVALGKLKTFHKYHKSTMDWLRANHVPIVNLDCSGNAENVWQQLVAIGRLMRPTAKAPI